MRVFRKVQTKQEDFIIIPFVNTVEETKPEISQVHVNMRSSLSTIQLEDLMPLEEYSPDIRVMVPVLEEASGNTV